MLIVIHSQLNRLTLIKLTLSTHQIFLLLGFQAKIRRARLQRGVLCVGEPQAGAAAGGHEQESPSADHGAEREKGGVRRLVDGWTEVEVCWCWGGSEAFMGAYTAVDISKPLKYSWTFLTRFSTFVSQGDGRKWPAGMTSRMVKGGFTFQKTCLIKYSGRLMMVKCSFF